LELPIYHLVKVFYRLNSLFCSGLFNYYYFKKVCFDKIFEQEAKPFAFQVSDRYSIEGFWLQSQPIRIIRRA